MSMLIAPRVTISGRRWRWFPTRDFHAQHYGETIRNLCLARMRGNFEYGIRQNGTARRYLRFIMDGGCSDSYKMYAVWKTLGLFLL